MEPEAYAELYELEAEHWWYRGMRDITDRLLSNALDGRGDLLILDAGCGVGGNLTALARFGRVVGIDFSPLALGYAARSHTGRLARASVERLPYPDDTFDLVVSFDVIYHRAVSDDLAALQEFARVVRSGGRVLIRVPALPALRGPHDAVVHGARRYVAGDLRPRLEQAGLVVSTMTYANSLLLPAVFLARILDNLRIRWGGSPRSDVGRTPPLINALLTGILGLEARWIGRQRRFPLGVSLIALAAKPG